jgi:hypothetical protein
MNFKSLILLSFSISTIGAATIVGSATQASAADVCKNVSITIENGTNDPIKVTKFEYQDTRICYESTDKRSSMWVNPLLKSGICDRSKTNQPDFESPTGTKLAESNLKIPSPK